MLDVSKIYKSNNYGFFEIVNYINSISVEIEFISTGNKKITRADLIRKGIVRDELAPSVCGVGFVGLGKHKTSKNKKTTKVYYSWSKMIIRCYSKKHQKMKPTYAGVTVCNEWLNFQVYGDWYVENYIEGLHLDKDIKQQGVKNKIYSPETCLFVTPSENTIEALAKNYVMISPLGDVVNIYNMSKFCEDNLLKRPCMARVARGTQKKYKGWALSR